MRAWFFRSCYLRKKMYIKYTIKANKQYLLEFFFVIEIMMLTGKIENYVGKSFCCFSIFVQKVIYYGVDKSCVMS